jgi:hypothetical protein
MMHASKQQRRFGAVMLLLVLCGILDPASEGLAAQWSTSSRTIGRSAVTRPTRVTT